MKLSQCCNAKYGTERGKECWYYVCSACDKRINDICTNERDHSCEKHEEPKDDLPIGYTKWLQHGKKYGYDEFFRKRVLEEFLERIENVKVDLATYREIKDVLESLK